MMLQTTLATVLIQVNSGKVQQTNALQLQPVQILNTIQEITLVQIVLVIVNVVSQVYMTSQECA
jgi:hypothetical protein